MSPLYHLHGRTIAIVLYTIAGSAVITNTLLADSLRGRVTHAWLEDITVAGATINVTDVNDGTRNFETTSDSLGYFQVNGLLAGDELRLTTRHPGYVTDTQTITLAEGNPFEEIRMTPAGDAPEQRVPPNVIVQVTGAVSQLPLGGVPVTFQRYDAQGDPADASLTYVTSSDGSATLRGAMPGTYGFTINTRDALNNGPRGFYQTYTTTPAERALVTSDHLVSVFLKPDPQDLRVRVRGFDFLKQEPDQRLKDVLVEIRGLDPDDHTVEAIHPRSDYTTYTETNGMNTNNTVVQNSLGEVVFTGLPPLAYEVRVSRLGYRTQTQIVSPDGNGKLPYSNGSPLEITLQEEQHNVEIRLEQDLFLPTVTDNFGAVESFGVNLHGLSTKLVGIEGSNTEGLNYESFTGSNLAGETVAQFFENVMAGRYRVYVDGISEEAIRVKSGFNTEQVSDAYDIRAQGEGTIEVLPSDQSFAITQASIPVRIPKVTLTGRAVVAEGLEPGGDPIYRPLTDTALVFETIQRGNHLRTPAKETVFTDATGRFQVNVLPGAYGIHIPGKTDLFGHEVIVTTGNAARERDADKTTTFQWPLVTSFPEFTNEGSSVAHWYFATKGLAIHAGREQELELRLFKEVYAIETFGSEDFAISSRATSTDKENDEIFTLEYSEGVANTTRISLAHPSGMKSADVTARPPTVFDRPLEPLFARWENLPPGVYSDPQYRIANHVTDTQFFGQKTFFDWPEPGIAPDPEMARRFYTNNLPDETEPLRPLYRHLAGGFSLTYNDSYEGKPIKTRVWNPDEERYDDGADLENAGLFELAEIPGLFGGSVKIGGPVTTVWAIGRNEEEFYPVRLSPGGTLVLGGASATPRSTYPDISHTLTIEAVSDSDPDIAINGATFKVGSATVLSGTPTPDLTDFSLVSKEDTDNFILVNQGMPEFVVRAASPTVRIRVTLERGMEIDATFNKLSLIGSEPFAHTPIEVRNRYGRVVSTNTTDEDGHVTFRKLPGYADYFLTLEVPGYEPIRRKLLASEAGPGVGDASLRHMVTQDIRLLDQPEILTQGNPLDRWGLFLTHVDRFGNVDLKKGLKDFNFFQDKEALKATWKLRATQPPLDFKLPGFANDEGDFPAEDEVVDGHDRIVAAYLIDEREFEDAGYIGSTMRTPGTPPFELPQALEPEEMASFINRVAHSKFVRGNRVDIIQQARRTFSDRASKITARGNETFADIEGEFRIPDLPPGTLEPRYVLQTQRGAYQIFRPSFSGDAAKQQLEGMELPGWMANLLDLFGIMSGVVATQGKVKEYVPGGQFTPLPEFSSSVSLDKKENESGGFLNYSYGFAVGEEVGQESSSSGLLGISPSFLGASVKASASLDAKGRDGSVGFTLGGGLERENINGADYSDKLSAASDIEVTIGKVEGSMSLSADINQASNHAPFDFRIQRTTQGSVSVQVDATLNRAATGIPYIGPFINLAGKTKLARLILETTVSAAMRQTYTTQTKLPHRDTRMETRLRDSRVDRHSFLGSGAVVESQSELCLGLGIKSGLKFAAELAGYSASAKVLLVIGGAKSCGTSASAVETTFRTDGTWPVLQQIKGHVGVVASIEATDSYFKPHYSWEIAKLPFTKQFGTTTQVFDSPIDSNYQAQGILSLDDTQLAASGPRLVKDLAPAATFTTTGTDGQSLVYTAHDTSTGKDTILWATRQNDGSWSDPEILVSTEQLGESIALTLANGRTVIAYAELVPGELEADPYANGWVKVFVRESDGTLSDVTNLGSFLAMPSQLQLAESGDRVALYVKLPQFRETGSVQEIFGVTFDGSTWSNFAHQITETSFLGHTILAGENDFTLAWVSGEGRLRSKRFDSANTEELATSMSAPIIGVTTGGTYEVVAIGANDQLQLFKATEGQRLDFDRDLMSAPATDSIELTSFSNGNRLLVWGQGSRLRYATYASTGTATEPQTIAESFLGYYEDIKVYQDPDQAAATILVRYDHKESDELRQFTLNQSAILTNDDQDGDNVSDAAELRIVDVDPNDALVTIADIDANADYDNDGLSNGSEIRNGTDPINPNIASPLKDTPFVQWLQASLGNDAPPEALSFNADLDGDGLNNLVEYAFQLDPTTMQQGEFFDLTVSSDDHLELRYRKNTSASDIDIILEGGTDLNQFTDQTALFEEVSSTPLGGDASEVLWRSLNPRERSSPTFFRLRAVLQP